MLHVEITGPWTSGENADTACPRQATFVLGLTEFGEGFSSTTLPSPISMAKAAEQS